MKKSYVVILSATIVIVIIVALVGQMQNEGSSLLPSRESRIPIEAVKVLPQNDSNPPISLSSEYYDPVPLQGKVNTAGVEDSAFVIANGSVLYFFFTPDVGVPVEQQVLDSSVGIYVSRKENGVWTEPERVLLQDKGKLAMDGCEFVQDNVMYFCSAREGYTGLHWFKAEYVNGKWQNWQNADDYFKKAEFETGELQISSEGGELYFHSSRESGVGGLDIWVSSWVNGEWFAPENVGTVNSAGDEGWPALSPNGNELWFSRDYAVWRSKRVEGEWQTPEKMFSPLCGEPSVDQAGNVYFTHHFFRNDTMIEADIYVAYPK